jgi:dTDP-4-dehydrorhamnose 3,5-epimerase
MELINTYLSGVYIVKPNPIVDNRGFFVRTYCKQEFLSIGFDKNFVQFNHSFNLSKGTIRGLHFQKPPYAEKKYVRCVNGSIFDVVVDIRKDSPTYLQYFNVELSFFNMLGLIIPEGCAHGFQVLEDNTSIIYHHSEFYHPNSEKGLRYDDPVLSIHWPLEVKHISDRDKNFAFIDHQFEPLQP